MKQIHQPYIIQLAAILISITLIIFGLYQLKVVFIPLLFSIIFAVMIFPLCFRLEKLGFSKGLAAFVTVLFTTIILGLIGYILVAQISLFTEQIPEITHKINLLINDLRDFAAHKFSMKKTVVAGKIQEQLSQLQNSSNFINGNMFNAISSILINIFLIPLYVFFLIYYRHFFIEFFYKIFHSAHKILIDEILQKIEHVIKGYLFGQFLDILIIGTANAALLYFIGVGYPIVLGFLIATLCIIPYLGMIVGSLLAVLVAFITTDTSWQPLTAFIVLWIIHMIDSNLVAPLIIGHKVSLNLLVAIFVLFLFGKLWGLPGLFLAIPLTAILKVIFDAVPGLQPYGFLLGEPQKYHLKKHSFLYVKILQKKKEKENQKPVNESLSDEPGTETDPDQLLK
ncbi:MAG: AI-2E family transporter [Bacteroidia bacterium]|nr:AI-2E family transporter [Bacteroidia bacterium]